MWDQRSKIILNSLFWRSLFVQDTVIFWGHGYARNVDDTDVNSDRKFSLSYEHNSHEKQQARTWTQSS